jgi:drug/metabolite transporter (DMT)-like permease
MSRADVIELIGACLIVAGVVVLLAGIVIVSLPAALIVAGVLAAGAGVAIVRRAQRIEQST